MYLLCVSPSVRGLQVLYVVAQRDVPSQTQLDANKQNTPRGGEGHLFMCRGRWWEVTALKEAKGDHSTLQTTFKNLQAMVELAQRMQVRDHAFLRRIRLLACPHTYCARFGIEYLLKWRGCSLAFLCCRTNCASLEERAETSQSSACCRDIVRSSGYRKPFETHC
jgi:hypothetical protein